MKMQRLRAKWTGLIALGVMMAMLFSVQVGNAAAAQVEYIDTHNHPLMLVPPGCLLEEARLKTVVLDNMDRFGIQKTLFMPPPLPPGLLSPCGWAYLAEIARRHPDRFAFLRGGESLNPMTQDVVLGRATVQETRPQFVKAANDIYRAGAVGFGEMAAEHFSLHKGHPYISAPPDHPLFLLLADIAAGHDVPIDLHMEAITEDIQRDDLCEISHVCDPGTENPETFRENLTAFERLLRHNRQARIIWVHAGWDNTGHRTAELTRRLLGDHPNLYIQLRPLTPGRVPEPGRPNSILARDDSGQLKIRDKWLELIEDFPGRFVVGLDSFYSKFKPDLPDDFFVPLLELGKAFVRLLYQELSQDVADKVSFENAVRIYRLDQTMICHRPGTPAEQVLRIDANAWQGHVAHGDTLGPCG